MRSKRQVNCFIGERLRTIRVSRGMKVQEVAERAGLPASSYSCLEGGWYNINLDNLFKILQVLQAEIHEVWPGVQTEHDWIVDDKAVQDALEKARADQPRHLSTADVLEAVCYVYGVDKAQLSSGSRKRRLSEARTAAAVLVKEIPHLSLTSLSELLGVHISSLSHCIKRLQQRPDTAPEVFNRIELARRRLWEEFNRADSPETEPTPSPIILETAPLLV